MDLFEQAKQRFMAGINAMGRQAYTEAVSEFQVSLQLLPDRISTLTNLAAAYIQLHQWADARKFCDRALVIDPLSSAAWTHLGLVENANRLHRLALEHFERALHIDPSNIDAQLNRVATFIQLQEYTTALTCSQQLLQLAPDHASAHLNHGNILSELGQDSVALEHYQKSITLDPKFAKAYLNQGHALQDTRQPEQALISYRQAFALDPTLDFLLGNLLHLQLILGDWFNLEELIEQLLSGITQHKKRTPPFAMLGISDSPLQQLRTAEIWVKDKYPDPPISTELACISQSSSPHSKIRIGFFSMDFRNHAVAFLIAGIIEILNRDQFQVIAFNFGLVTNDEMQTRLRQGFDQFLDIHDKTDLEIIKLAKQHQIDIAVDLAGFTEGSRPTLFAQRIAPIQINYLGFPGTMGAGYIDYIIADHTLVPSTSRPHFSEKIVYLPCFQATDSQRFIALQNFTRQALGLSDSVFVYCCFNNSYKILPETFQSWMRILKASPNSVLWLLYDHAATVIHRQQAARAAGIDPQRLVFAHRLPPAEYLARYRCADLFLDTLPFNAGTTCSDALWAGLPVLTLRGESFAARMGASLLTAIHLPELITTSREAYEARAIELATDRQQLQAIRDKLARNRLTTPLFNTALFARHLETAFIQMVERQRAGLAPDHLFVDQPAVLS